MAQGPGGIRRPRCPRLYPRGSDVADRTNPKIDDLQTRGLVLMPIALGVLFMKSRLKGRRKRHGQFKGLALIPKIQFTMNVPGRKRDLLGREVFPRLRHHGNEPAFQLFKRGLTGHITVWT